MLTVENLAQRDAQHLTTLVENRLHYPLEELFIAVKMVYLVTCHADNGTLHLGGRIEDRRLHSKEILYVVPGLNQY